MDRVSLLHLTVKVIISSELCQQHWPKHTLLLRKTPSTPFLAGPIYLPWGPILPLTLKCFLLSTQSLWNRSHYYPHHSDEDSRVQGGEVTYSRSHRCFNKSQDPGEKKLSGTVSSPPSNSQQRKQSMLAVCVHAWVNGTEGRADK